MELSDFNITEESIKEVLASGAVYFTYRKKDGTERGAYGTRNTGIIKDHNATPVSTGTEKIGVITYYDLDSNGWRCFKIENLIGFKTVCAA